MPPKAVFIDLLSSPDAPRPILKETNAPPSKAFKNGETNSEHVGFVSLLSDDDDASEWPAEEPASKSSAIFGGSSWNFDNLEGSKQELQNVPARAPTAEPIQTAVKVADFGFLEDDFDSTVNFDDSILIELPPLKKRRLSPSPKIVHPPRNGGYNRSLSNIEVSSTTKVTAKRKSSAPLKRSYTTSARMESDPIMFTSSPDHVADAARKRREKATVNFDSDDDIDTSGVKPAGEQRQDKGKARMSDIFPSLSSDDLSMIGLGQTPEQSGRQATNNMEFTSKRTDFTFEDSSDIDLPISRTAKAKSKYNLSGQAKSKSSIAISSILDRGASPENDDDDVDISRENSQGKPKPKPPLSQGDAIIAKVKADRAKSKAAEAKADAVKARKAAKDAEKEEKRLEKERKAKEKQKAAEIATVNTLRTDKKLTTPEMIVELPNCLEKKLMSQTKTFLEDVKAGFTEWESLQPIVKWKRKVVAEFDDDEGQWKPVSQYLSTEKHVMYVMTAKELVQHVTGDDGHDLSTFVALLKSKYEFSKIIFLIEGVTAWYRRNLSIKKKQFEAAVRSHGPQAVQPTASQRKKTRDDEYINEQLVEDALLELQILHGFLIHHTGAMPETAQWIKIFTENISSVPYKKINLDTGFCMETGQVKTGENISDTYTKMLQEMIRVTLPVACGIAYEYPTVQQLVKGLERKGPMALEDCRKSANKDGAFTDRRVGKAISKRVYDVFMGKDAQSWDV